MKPTQRQLDYIGFLGHYFQLEDQFPSVKALADGLGVAPNAACEMLLRLEKHQILTRNSAGKYKRGPRWSNTQSWMTSLPGELSIPAALVDPPAFGQETSGASE